MLVPVLPASVMADTPGGPPLDATLTFTSATLVARGVAVDVGLDVVCEPDEVGPDWTSEYGIVSVDQRAGKYISRDWGQIPYGIEVTCDGVTANHLSVIVRAETSPFRVGVALLSAEVCLANLDNYQSYGCVSDTATMRLRPK